MNDQKEHMNDLEMLSDNRKTLLNGGERLSDRPETHSDAWEEHMNDRERLSDRLEMHRRRREEDRRRFEGFIE